MATTLIVARQPAGATQRADLEKLFASPAFQFLKEMVASRCVVHQVEAMNAMLYPNNEDAVAKLEAEKRRSSECALVLDMLDDISKKEEEWFTVAIERNNA